MVRRLNGRRYMKESDYAGTVFFNRKYAVQTRERVDECIWQIAYMLDHCMNADERTMPLLKEGAEYIELAFRKLKEAANTCEY